MPKTESGAEVPEQVIADSFDLTIDEFCLRLSTEIVAPELIGGFNHVEKAAGRVKDSEAAYRARYELFRNTPA